MKKCLIFMLLCIFAFITIFPFLWMLLNSFSSESHIFRLPPAFWPDLLGTPNMWDNYRTIFKEFNFDRYSFNSLFIATLCGIGQIFTCSLSGFVFAQMKFRGKNLIFSALLITLMIPPQVTIIPEYFIVTRLNWLDTYLPLIIPSFLVGSFGTFMFKEYYETIPSSLVDAAIIDGAKPFTMYYRVFIPQSGPQMVTLFIITFMNNWNDLLRPILYLSDERKQTVTMALTQFQSQYTAKWNLLLAGGVLSVLPLLIIFIFLQRFIIQSSVSSGIKG